MHGNASNVMFILALLNSPIGEIFVYFIYRHCKAFRRVTSNKIYHAARRVLKSPRLAILQILELEYRNLFNDEILSLCQKLRRDRKWYESGQEITISLNLLNLTQEHYGRIQTTLAATCSHCSRNLQPGKSCTKCYSSEWAWRTHTNCFCELGETSNHCNNCAELGYHGRATLGYVTKPDGPMPEINIRSVRCIRYKITFFYQPESGKVYHTECREQVFEGDRRILIKFANHKHLTAFKFKSHKCGHCERRVYNYRKAANCHSCLINIVNEKEELLYRNFTT